MPPSSMASKRNASMSSSLRRDLVEKNATQIRDIQVACDYDFELQALLLVTIENYKGSKFTTSAGELLRAMAEENRGEQTADQPSHNEVADWGEMPEGTLRRGQLVYKRWTVDLALRLFKYCEPELRHLTTKGHPIIQLKYLELSEFAFDVQCGKYPDKVATDSLPDLFARTRSVYIQKGHRLRLVLGGIVNNHLSWVESGFYSIEVKGDTGALEVTILNRITNQQRRLPPGIVGKNIQEFAQGEIALNYSQSDAMIVTTDCDTYHLGTFFPVERRGLKRGFPDDGKSVVAASAKPKQVSINMSGIEKWV